MDVRVVGAAAAEGSRERVRLGGVGLDTLKMEEALAYIDASVQERSPLHVVTANMQFLGVAARSTAFASVVEDAGLVVGDGVPLLWLSRLSGCPIPQRITGHDLVHACSALAVARGYRVALLGGAEGAGEAAAMVLQAQHPGIAIAGVFDGRFMADGDGASASDEEGLTGNIRDARPDVLFVGLGCPKQEYWIARHIKAVDVPVCIGTGGVFDVLAGRKRRAPRWMQRAGLEWSYRFMQEPQRLWRRYLAQDLPLLAGLAVSLSAARFRRRMPGM